MSVRSASIDIDGEPHEIASLFERLTTS
jgi:hypothetical protein